jgi:hypothetical protein
VCYFNNVWFIFLDFQKKLFFSNNLWFPPSPWSFTFSTPVLYPVDPPRPVLRISHFGSLICWSPPLGPSHFPLWFFNPSIPPCPVLHISHSNSLTFQFQFLKTQHEQKNRRFFSFQQPCRAYGFRGRTVTLLAGSLTLSLFWDP